MDRKWSSKRRSLLRCAGVTAMMVNAGLTRPALAQPAAAELPRRIDVHAHYLPAAYREAAIAAGHAKPDGMPGLPPWDSGAAVAAMDRLNIQTAMLSVSSPGVHFGDDAAARKLARMVNEEGAKAMSTHPGRFGLFASLPLPDVDGTLAEVGYALDTLKADGVVIESNHDGLYLGDRRLAPLFDELNRRKAVVFLHPTSPSCPHCVDLALGYPRPMLEFMFETTRSITNLILSGTLDRYPDIRLIVPHAGATLPVMADRVQGLSPALGLQKPEMAQQFHAKLRRLHYDLAGFPLPALLPALLKIADPGRIMYGSDWPFTPEPLVRKLSADLAATDIMDAALRQRVFTENAKTLFPRLAT